VKRDKGVTVITTDETQTIFNIRPKHSRLFGYGEVRSAVLSLLAHGPRHGYGIMKDFASRIGPDYRANAGSVYPVLKQLETDGLVTCKTEDGRKTFSLTRDGKRELAKDPDALGRMILRRQREAATVTGPAGDVAASLHRLQKAAYKAAETIVGNLEREVRLRKALQEAAELFEEFGRSGAGS
jgi:DNA-binding PadR family transcriptional regulator